MFVEEAKGGRVRVRHRSCEEMIVHRFISQTAAVLAALALAGCASGQSGSEEGTEGASTATIADTMSEPDEPVRGDTIHQPNVRRDSTDSGLEGRVTIGPTCPAQEIGRECPAKPYAATLLIRDAASGEVLHRIRSDEDGRFRLALAPGSYVVAPPERRLVGEPEAEPVNVTVRPGQWASVHVSFDSGAR